MGLLCAVALERSIRRVNDEPLRELVGGLPHHRLHDLGQVAVALRRRHHGSLVLTRPFGSGREVPGRRQIDVRHRRRRIGALAAQIKPQSSNSYNNGK
jgi:hypothetical protein